MKIVESIMLISATILITVFAIGVVFAIGLFIFDEVKVRIDETRDERKERKRRENDSRV